jgi:hypothetical protein
MYLLDWIWRTQMMICEILIKYNSVKTKQTIDEKEFCQTHIEQDNHHHGHSSWLDEVEYVLILLIVKWWNAN